MGVGLEIARWVGNLDWRSGLVILFVSVGNGKILFVHEVSCLFIYISIIPEPYIIPVILTDPTLTDPPPTDPPHSTHHSPAKAPATPPLPPHQHPSISPHPPYDDQA